MFEGDIILVAATEGRESEQATTTAKWIPYVSGEIVEYDIPCTHSELTAARKAGAGPGIQYPRGSRRKSRKPPVN